MCHFRFLHVMAIWWKMRELWQWQWKCRCFIYIKFMLKDRICSFLILALY